MMKLITITALFVTTSAMAAPAYACGFHGGGFGGFGNANWQPYNPQASTEDPALLNKTEAALMTPVPAKKRPSFSNVANRASLIAKARMAKKIKDQKQKAANEASEEASKKPL